MEDLTWDGLESDEHEEEEGEEEEAYEEEQCEGDQDEDLKGDEILAPINRPHPETSLPASSPKRKRARITTHNKSESMSSSATFLELRTVPIYKFFSQYCFEQGSLNGQLSF